MTFEGEVVSIPRALGKKAKEVTTRLGKPDDFQSVEETRQRIARVILPKMQSHIDAARANAVRELAAMEARRAVLTKAHLDERAKLDAGQMTRANQEARAQADRLRKGLGGLWDRPSGKRRAQQKQSELEALWSLQRDREQRQALIAEQLTDRQALQAQIKALRSKHAAVLRGLHHDRANLRLMDKGLEPRQKVKPEFQQRSETSKSRSKGDTIDKGSIGHTPARRSAPKAINQGTSDIDTRAA